MGSLFGNIARGVMKSPLLKTGLNIGKMVPGLGTVLGAASLGMTAYSAVQGLRGAVGGGGMPALPSMGGGAMMLPSNPAMGSRGIFRNDANLPDALKPFAISKGDLKQYYRAPKGFIIRHDSAGDAYAVPKKIAKAYLGWRPAKKPLLSIRDTNAIRHAGSVINKLTKFEKTVKKIANYHAPKHHPKNIIIGRKK